MLRPEVRTAPQAAAAGLAVPGVKAFRARREGGRWTVALPVGLGVGRSGWDAPLTAQEAAALADDAGLIFRLKNPFGLLVGYAWAPGVLSRAVEDIQHAWMR